jgi:ribosomal protein S18 acetylase RimI-like enzyme
MANVKIKKVEVSELIALLAISRQTFEEAFSADNSKEDMELYLRESLSLKQLKMEIDNQQSAFYFAIVTGEIAAYLKVNYQSESIDQNEIKSLEIERVYVLKKFQRQKIGQLLFTKAIELAKEYGSEYIWLGVWERNYNAIAFYEKNGMRYFGRKAFRLGNDDQTDVMMKLDLH